MGIDVRAYAQANQDVKRAACVGCGMCAHMCPRGVLKLENRPVRFRTGEPLRVYPVDLYSDGRLELASRPKSALLQLGPELR